jgi:Acetyltransferase (GNAT) domain
LPDLAHFPRNSVPPPSQPAENHTAVSGTEAQSGAMSYGWGMSVTFRPVAEADFPDLYDWLNRPHLRRFFQKAPISLSGIAAKYGPAVRGEEPVHLHLALLEGRPFGFIQCYRILDHPAWAETIGRKEGIGVDLCIFEPGLIRQGLGRAMLTGYLADVAFPLYPAETKCFIGHDRENAAGLANSRAVGFRPVCDFVEDGRPSELLVLERAQLPPPSEDSRG